MLPNPIRHNIYNYKTHNKNFYSKINKPRKLINSLTEISEDHTELVLSMIVDTVEEYEYNHISPLEKDLINKIVEAIKESMPQQESKYLTPKQLAAEFGIAISTQAKYRKINSRTGKPGIPYSKVEGNIFYKRQDIYNWIDNGKII